MGLTQERFDDLAKKYGLYASWAIWNPAYPADTQIISNNLQCLKTSVIMVGLNIAGPLYTCWSNFHGDPPNGIKLGPARRLMSAFNDSSYCGAFMTDIVKEKEASSKKLLERIKAGQVDVGKHIAYFCDEMKALGAQRDALFIMWGEAAEKLFKDYLSRFYPNYKRCRHYSSFGTNAEWFKDTSDRLEEHYWKSKPEYNTLEFVKYNTLEFARELECKQTRRSQIVAPAIKSLEVETWNPEDGHSPATYAETGNMCADEDVTFRTHADACNCFGFSARVISKALVRHKVERDRSIWFPKLFYDSDWDNRLSDDEETIYTRKRHGNDEFKNTFPNRPTWQFKRLVFAKLLVPRGEPMYHFKGLYELNKEETEKTSTVTFCRTAKCVTTYAPVILRSSSGGEAASGSIA